MSSGTTLDQPIRFTTDSVSLERTLRLLQAVVQITFPYPFAFGLLLHTLNLRTAKAPSPTTTRFVLLAVHQRLNFARRFFRVFRFLDSFHAAHRLYLRISLSSSTTGKRKSLWLQAETWLNVLGPTFDGMYLLLDASTIVDALQIEGFQLWGPEWERTITVEGQRFWLFALVCGVFSGLLKMRKVVTYAPVTATGDGRTYGKMEGNGTATTFVTEKEMTGKLDETAESEMEIELQRLRNTAEARTKGWEVCRRLRGLSRNVVANALDIVLPGVIVGWIDASSGTVGLAMFTTTVLTGMDVWERCGRDFSAID